MDGTQTIRTDFQSPFTPRYSDVFYSSLPIDWQDDSLTAVVCLSCARDNSSPPSRKAEKINGVYV